MLGNFLWISAQCSVNYMGPIYLSTIADPTRNLKKSNSFLVVTIYVKGKSMHILIAI